MNLLKQLALPLHMQIRAFCAELPTVSTAIKHVTENLRSHLEDEGEAVSSADLIVAHALGKKRVATVNLHNKLSTSQWQQVLAHLAQRQRRVPVQYIIGEWDFLDFTLKMRPPILVPRPETEELVKIIQNNRDYQRSKKFLEIGCGSGAISIALLKSNEQLRGVAVDISEEACSLTQENAVLQNVQDRLFVCKESVTKEDFTELFRDQIPFDFIVSNPPYIPTKEIQRLQDEVKVFESHLALDGGEDGLKIIDSILHHAPKFITGHGSVWLEVNGYSSQPAKIKSLCDSKYPQLKLVDVLQDFQKIERFCHLKRAN